MKIKSAIASCLFFFSADAQNVGIGTTNPTATLEVIRGTSPNGTAMLRGTTHTSFFNNGAFEDTYIRAGKDNGYVILNNIAGGKVGIGLSIPQQLLSINGGMNIDQAEQNNGGIDNNVLRFGSNSGEAIGSARQGSNNLYGLDLYTNSLNRMSVTSGGNVGIGTANPQARFHVTDSSVVFSAAGNIPVMSGSTPVSGAGRRMMWFSDHAAFRAGFVNGTQWDRINIGYYSFAAGINLTATGYASTGMGSGTFATGFVSTAMGNATSAAGPYSTAMGYFTSATGNVSTAMGSITSAAGFASSAMGNGTFAEGYYSTAMGENTTAKASASLSIGAFNNNSDNPNPIVPDPADRILQIGNGTASVRSNAITVLRNGKTGIGLTDPQQALSIRGGMNIDQTNLNDGTIGDNVLRFGNNSGEAIGSARSGSSNLFGLDFYTGSAKRMSISNAGFVGIGIANPAVQLCVNGNIAYTSYLGACSDIRYKRNFTSFCNPLQSILSLNGFYYQWKKEEYPDMQFTGNRQLGFSAQEMEILFPEIVMTDNNGYKSVDYGRLTPVLVEAIKEQQKQIEELKKLVEKMMRQQLTVHERKTFVSYSFILN